MKAFKIFRAVLALVHLILLILLFSASLFLIYVLAGGNMNYPFELSPDVIVHSKTSLLSFLFFFIALTGGYFYFFTLLRKLAQSMGGKLFTKDQVRGFRQAGRLLIFLTITENVLAFLLSVVFDGIHIGFSFSEVMLYSGFGCFLLVLGEVFARGKVYKEENELTI